MDYEDMEYDDQNFYHEQDYGDSYYDGQGCYEEIEEDVVHDSKYRIISQSQIFQRVLKMANQCSVYTSLPMGWCILLLREFKWQIQNIPDYFQDIQKYREKIKYSANFKTPNDPSIFSQEVGDCLVCCEVGPLITNICGDTFCQDCWVGQIQSQITSMNPFITCMNCQAPMVYETIVMMFNRIKDGKNWNAKYQKLICEQFTMVNTSYQCCPGADCTYCIKSEDFHTTTVQCRCGKLFCFKCKDDDHSPISCQQKKKWINLVLKQEADAKWIAVNAKICPWCNKGVERSAGCNFMQCLCGKSFCYMCSKPWQPDHKDHFKCHIYKKNDSQKISKEKQILEKMNFYGEKYTMENKVVSELKKVDVFDKRRLLFQALGVDLTESDYIEHAYKFAIQCCESLKWIYVHRYYVKFESADRQEVFDFTQGEYQKYKQELLKKLSFDLKRFLDDLSQKHQDGEIGNKNLLLDSFFVLKKNIINYYTSTKQFKQKFMEEIHRVDIGLSKKRSEQNPVVKGVIKKKSQDPPMANGIKNKVKKLINQF